MTRRAPDPQRLARATELHKQGFSMRAIAAELGTSDTTVRTWLDPAYRERQNEARRKWGQNNPTHVVENTDRRYGHRCKPEHTAELLAQVPEDTRTPGQKLLGEPLPGRSALDRKVRGVSS